MTDVRLVRAAEDGQHLVLATEAGEEFSLPIDDHLRHAIRHARASVTQVRPEPDASAPAMSPKQIQQRIRSGLNAAELAEITGMPLASLEKYEPPVLAERAYIAELARGTRVGRDGDSPPLGDLVADRLAGRGVDIDSLAWDAWRHEGEAWQVCVDFRVDGTSTRAMWDFDHTARIVTALDDQSRWLTETELLDVPIPKRHLASVRDSDEGAVVSLHPSRPAAPEASETATGQREDSGSSTERLVDDLNGKRGTRESLDLDDDSDDSVGGRTRQADVGFAPTVSQSSHPAGTARKGPGRDSPPASADPPEDEASTDTSTRGVKRPAKKGRASVPSWDEIVFGAKHD